MGAAQARESDGDDVDALAVWELPRWPNKSAKSAGTQGTIVTAGRHFAAGEVLEQSYCLELDAGELAGSYLGRYCYNASWPRSDGVDGTRARYLPLQWGIVLLSSGAGREPGVEFNLVVEPLFEPPPPAPLLEGVALPKDVAAPAEPRGWLRFTASRPIAEGEVLRAAPPPGWEGAGAGCVFEAAGQALGLENVWYDSDCDDDTDDSEEDKELPDHSDRKPAPRRLRLPEEPLVLACASPLHGIGTFASRDIDSGEIIEYAPNLPLRDSDVTGILQDYVYQSGFKGSDLKINFLQFGCGMLHNHAGSSNTVFYRPFADNPFLQEWYAEEFIPYGSEVFSTYGDDYWDTRGITPGDPEGHRRRRCAC